MTLSRRAFLVASGAMPFAWPFAMPDRVHVPSISTIVIDHALSARLPVEMQTNARFIPLHGDAWWLWHEHVSPALSSTRVISGFTRPADAFVLTHLAQSSGLRTILQGKGDAVRWALFR